MSTCVSRNFSGIFEIIRIFSVALLIYLDISGFIFAQENISKKGKEKNISFCLGRARRPDPHPLRPSAAHLAAHLLQSLTGGGHLSSPTSGRTEPHPSSGLSRATPRVAPRLGPHAKAASLGIFKPHHHLLLAPFRENLAAELQLRRH
jgi:hypothetical protein